MISHCTSLPTWGQEYLPFPREEHEPESIWEKHLNPEKDLNPWVSPTCLGLQRVEGLQGHSRGSPVLVSVPFSSSRPGWWAGWTIPRTCSCVLCFLDSASPLPYCSCLDPSHSPTPFLLLSPQEMMVSDPGPSWPSPGGLTKPCVHGGLLAEPRFSAPSLNSPGSYILYPPHQPFPPACVAVFFPTLKVFSTSPVAFFLLRQPALTIMAKNRGGV